MPTFIVKGTDADSGKPEEMNLNLGSVPEVAEFAARRGIKVESIQREGGHTFFPNGKGGFLRDDETPSKTGPAAKADTALIAFAFLIPIIGLFAGAIRLARRDPSGTGVIIAGLIGAVLWTILFALAAQR